MTFLEKLGLEMSALMMSPIGKKFLAAGFTLEHTGGGILCWQYVVEGKPFLCWVSLSEEDTTGCDEQHENEPALWTCGIYPLDADGMMLMQDGPCDDLRGVDSAIDWCKQQLALGDPMKVRA